MKVISVIGISGTGKTTTIESIIRELKRRNYSVGTVKEIHFHAFQMDVEGTNTYRHKEAGASLVTARGAYETDILFQEKLSLDRILSFYDHDYVLLEGVRDTNIPKILTALDKEGIEDRFDESIVAISGKISAEITEYKGLPAINSLTNIEDLVDLIEEKSYDTKNNIEKVENCMLKINGRPIDINPFVERILRDCLEAIAKGLDGYEEAGDIEICIKR